MNKKKSMLLCLFICLLLASPLIVKADWTASGGGSGSSGAATSGKGYWDSKSVGARLTVVDQNGDRFKITLNNKTYTSKSIDYYADIAKSTSGYYAHTSTNNSHSTCNGYLCSRKEVQGAFRGTDGGYSFEAWPYQGTAALKLPTDYEKVGKGEQSIGDAIQHFDQYPAQATDLFQRLMGISVSDIQKYSASNCETNRKLLQNVYIIAEPVAHEDSGNFRGFSGTATEFGILWNGVGKYINGAFPSIINTAIIPNTNLGHSYFTAVSSNFKIPTYTVSYGTWGNYYNRYIRDTRPGVGISIIHVDADLLQADKLACYDYSIDAACVNCSAKNFGNKAYVIQDTTDWNAILNSSSSNVANIKNYYNKGNGVFCREEYQVNFPDVEGNIKVNTGRYFTVNATNKELEALTTSAPNFKPITVTRTRQCKSSSNNTSALSNFERNSRSTFKDNAGTVTLKYTENKSDSKYSKKSITLVQNKNADNTYSSNISNNMLTMTQTVSYTLKDGVYRYIRLQDGLSIYDPSGIKQSELNTKYKDLGISNLPISFENETESEAKIADIQLSYELPSDPNSKIKSAYKKNNDYFVDPSNKATTDNIYQKAIDAGAVSNNNLVQGSLDSNTFEQLKNSACAKLYWNGSGYNSGLYSCVYNRTKNKIGNNNDCIVQNDLNNNNAGYICPVTNKGNNGICRIENGKYYLGDGTEVSKDEYYKVCPSTNKCRVENGKYYLGDGTEVSKEVYERECDPVTPPGECENGEEPCEDGLCPEDHDGGVCPICDDDCEYGCCPSGECAPMPGGICPGSGGKDVIYRTIDLENPFPGQNAEQRRTGSNWCSYNIRTQKIDCKYNNAVSNKYIIKNGDKVYNENHILYEVTLDSQTINSIRNYNDKNKYDDWKLNCKDNGKACISEFLNKQVKVTGLCSGAESKDSFYSCNKDVS